MAGGAGVGRLTHYDVLGVGSDASAEELRRAYLRLARAHHPDNHGGDDAAGQADAERRMQAVTAAWAVLGNPARRREYDRSLRGAGRDDPAGFRPFDPTPAPDPRDVPDAPYRPSSVAPGARSLSVVVPVALFAGSVLLFCVGLVTGAAPLLGGAVVLFVVAAAGFLVLPLVELSRARDDEG